AKWPLSIGMLLVATAAGSLAMWNDRPWQVLAAMPILGAGIGFAYAAMATLITEAVRPTETGVATGMNTVMRTVGGVIGGQVGAALLAAHTVNGTHGVPSVVGFEIAFAISAVAALVGATVAVFVTPPRLQHGWGGTQCRGRGGGPRVRLRAGGAHAGQGVDAGRADRARSSRGRGAEGRDGRRARAGPRRRCCRVRHPRRSGSVGLLAR